MKANLPLRSIAAALCPNPNPQPQPEPSPSGSRQTLREGSRGGDVEYLQTRLKDYGYNIDVDGAFGPATSSAVRAFQNANGLESDGIVGPATWTALG